MPARLSFRVQRGTRAMGEHEHDPPWWLFALGAVCITALLVASMFAPNTGCSVSIKDQDRPHHAKAAQ